jgi:F-type H+-transporting ATPase subunit a
VRAIGVKEYLRSYLQPNPFMLPFNLMGELTRTLALAVRLFGNIMSGNMLFIILVGVITTVLRSYAMVFYTVALPLTIFVQVLSLITAVIQAYIFTVLALVYIGAATQTAPTPAGNTEPDTQTQQ